MTTLEILGRDHTNESLLWVRFDDDEVAVSDIALAVARRTLQHGEYEPMLRGHPVDETQITTLVAALYAPQPFWPPVVCRVGGCGTEAVVLVDEVPYCHTHSSRNLT